MNSLGVKQRLNVEVLKRRKLNLRADEERIRRVAGGRTLLLYGQTPRGRQARDMEALSEYLGHATLQETAQFVLDTSHAEKAELLKEFYASLDYDGVEELYDEVEKQILEEEEELRRFEEGVADPLTKLRKARGGVVSESDSDEDTRSAVADDQQTFLGHVGDRRPQALAA